MTTLITGPSSHDVLQPCNAMDEDVEYCRRGKRRALRSRNSSNKSKISNLGYSQFSFVPIPLLSNLSDMTCDVQSGTCSGYYRCSHCPQVFCAEDEYTAHMRACHSLHPPSPKSASKLRCCTCGYTASDKNKAKMHERLHRDEKKGVPVFKCHSCSFLSCSKVGMSSHKTLEHAPQNIQCPTCSYSSFNARHVTAHVSKVHCPATDEEMFDCPYCESRFNKGHDLRVHLEHDHPDESLFKEFTCDLCDYVCHTNTDIVHHVKAHRTKKKLIRCSMCCFISTNSEKYTRHVENNHQIVREEVEKLYDLMDHVNHKDRVDPEDEMVHVDEADAMDDSFEVDVENSPEPPQPSIPVIRVVQKKEPQDDGDSSTTAELENFMYTPPSSPVIKTDPGNIFDRLNLTTQDKTSVCNAVGLRRSPVATERGVECKEEGVESKPKFNKHKASAGLLNRKSLKRCRYCTTKTMFDTLSKLREHHIKAHGINDLGVQFGLKVYICKYCLDIKEFDGLHALKDHYAKYHPASSIRKLIKRARSQNNSTESEAVEIPKIQPSLLDQIDIAESSCATKKQDMLDCILQSQKQIGKALKDASPECTDANLSTSRLGRIKSAPGAIYDKPPSVLPIEPLSKFQVPFKTSDSAPPTPLIPPATLGNLDTSKPLSEYLNLANLANFESIYNLSIAELRYLHQCYLYQAYCMNLYYSDPVYRQYVHDTQLADTIKKDPQECSGASNPRPSVKISDPQQILNPHNMVKIPDPRSLSQPSTSTSHQTVGLKLTQPKLTTSPIKSPRSNVGGGGGYKTCGAHECFVTGCTYRTSKLSDLKVHVTDDHNIRITDTMLSDLNQQIKNQEVVRSSPPARKNPNVTINQRIHNCTHCNEVLSSFDEYVQHLIETHRNELGIVSQGALPNTFSTHFTPPLSGSTKNVLLSPIKPKLNLTSPKLSSVSDVAMTPKIASPSKNMTSPSDTVTSPANLLSTPSSSSDQSTEMFECTSCYFVGPSADALQNHEIVHNNAFHS